MILLSYRVKCIRFVTFAVVTLTACSERLVACKNNLCENNIYNNTDSYGWFPFDRLENKNQRIET